MIATNSVAGMPVAAPEPTARPLVRIEQVYKELGGNPVLKGIDLTAHEGEVLCLLGPSGAGKSTLLRCINAIEQQDRGMVFVDGVSIGAELVGGRYVRIGASELARQRSQIGMVFQNFNLFPHMTVLRNIMDAPVRVLGISRSEAEARARDLLQRVGLGSFADAYPRHLSGGQQQRVAIARALAMKPKLMLFDEPTSALDPHLTEEVLNVIRDLAVGGMTMIVVTHEIEFVRDLGGTVVVMIDGVIVEKGPASVVLSRPTDARVRQFLARSLRQSDEHS